MFRLEVQLLFIPTLDTGTLTSVQFINSCR